MTRWPPFALKQALSGADGQAIYFLSDSGCEPLTIVSLLVEAGLSSTELLEQPGNYVLNLAETRWYRMRDRAALPTL